MCYCIVILILSTNLTNEHLEKTPLQYLNIEEEANIFSEIGSFKKV